MTKSGIFEFLQNEQNTDGCCMLQSTFILQSSASDSYDNTSFQKRSCFTSYVGTKPVDMEASMKRSCFISLKGINFVSESFSSTDSNKLQSKNLAIDPLNTCITAAVRPQSAKASYKSMEIKEKTQNSSRKTQIKVSTTVKKNNIDFQSPLSPSAEPFDPTSINVPNSIFAPQDDDDDNHSVTVRKMLEQYNIYS